MEKRQEDLVRLLKASEFELKQEGALVLLEEYKRRPFSSYAWAVFNLIEILGSPDSQHRELALMLLPKVADVEAIQNFGTLMPSFFSKVGRLLL